MSSYRILTLVLLTFVFISVSTKSTVTKTITPAPKESRAAADYVDISLPVSDKRGKQKNIDIDLEYSGESEEKPEVKKKRKKHLRQHRPIYIDSSSEESQEGQPSIEEPDGTHKKPEDDNYMVLYNTKFAFRNVDEFGLLVKYNKSENVHYGNAFTTTSTDTPEPALLQMRGEFPEMHPGEDPRIRIFPYVDEEGQWRLQNMTGPEVFPRTHAAWNPDTLKIHFYLYTRKNPEDGTEIENENHLARSHFNKEENSVFLIHGWLKGEDQSRAFPDMRRAYLEIGDYNVFMVDWPDQTANTNFHAVSDTVTEVGRTIAIFIKLLVKIGGTSFDQIKLVGHSLGAHVAGIAGENLSGQINSISGLDAADYLTSDPGKYLSKGDAQFVEVLHSSIAGIYQPIGDADIYFNDGLHQPGCLLPPCSHSIINQYFIEAITNPTGFELEKCGSLKNFENDQCRSIRPARKFLSAHEPDRSVTGILRVRTRSRQPYATNTRIKLTSKPRKRPPSRKRRVKADSAERHIHQRQSHN